MSALALAVTEADDADTANELPPNWQADPTLKAELPPHLDHRHYRRIVQAPFRYVVNVIGGTPAVWDLQRKRAVKPDTSKHPLRPRYRINGGKFFGTDRLYLARIVCEAVYGPAPTKEHEAHHEHLDRGNGWANLRWKTGEENRAIERIRPEQRGKQRGGSKNSNSKGFLNIHSMLFYRYRSRWSVKEVARLHNISPSQLRRILNGECRRDEVIAARKLYQPHWHLPPLKPI